MSGMCVNGMMFSTFFKPIPPCAIFTASSSVAKQSDAILEEWVKVAAVASETFRPDTGDATADTVLEAFSPGDEQRY